ncbi:catenin delta-2 isoform X2 [Tetranychus urticae]|uniref:catenin delta-2 isoform X2 n=1 Tax=Tetranychus urticae TaxID=32264 RepID=UPI00077BD873|nr:catenin delta-2 isoform X2 [Tetranychus urticae]
MDNYDTYGAVGSNYESHGYMPNMETYQRHVEYSNYRDYQINPSIAPSITSESPPTLRRGPSLHGGHQAGPPQPTSMQPINHMPQSGYDELDSTLQYTQFQHASQPSSNGYLIQAQPSPNGYAGSTGGSSSVNQLQGVTPSPGPLPPSSGAGLPMQSTANAGTYNPYELHPPSGYLDRRQSYDDHGTYSTAPMRGPPPRTVFPEDNLADPGSNLTGDGSVRWRDPDLHEVIEFLSHPNPVIRANAAAHLQHLCFSDDNIKQKARALGAIPPLINLITQDSLEIQRNACGALRNISYGRRNDENKKAVRNAGGLVALVNLLRKTIDNELEELITGVLWNLSSCDPLKRSIIDDALGTLVNRIIIPQSGWTSNFPNNDSSSNASDAMMQSSGNPEGWWSVIFRNASGVLRNVSSAGEYARKKLRECDGLVDSLLFLIRSAIVKNDIDNKSVENCVCILRNLSYRCQEIIDPEYDKHPAPITNDSRSVSPSSSRAVAIMGSVSSKVGDNLGCFGMSKKKTKETAATPTESKSLTQATQQLSLNTTGIPGINRRPNEPIAGMELLWQPEVVQPYLAILSECSNPETLEAAAGAIQNLAACYWQPSIDIRAAVRKEKGLPVLVELLRMEVDRVVCAVATALRNLALDPRNKELIGKYAMKDLVSKLPEGNPQHDMGTSDDTIAAVLATLNEVISKNADFAKSLLEADGMERLVYITKNKTKYSSRVFKFTSQLLANMWQHSDLREVYRKAGYKESHFLVRHVMSRNSSGGVLQSPTSSANNTLSRPMSTQGGTRYEDRTLSRGGGREMNMTQMSLNRPEEYQLSDMAHRGAPELAHTPAHLQNQQLASQQQLAQQQAQQQLNAAQQQQQQQQQQQHRPPVGGVQIYPPGVYIRGNSTEPVYAQVNRERKKHSRPGADFTSSTQALLGSDTSNSYDPTTNEPIYPPPMPAGDSWV